MIFRSQWGSAAAAASERVAIQKSVLARAPHAGRATPHRPGPSDTHTKPWRATNSAPSATGAVPQALLKKGRRLLVPAGPLVARKAAKEGHEAPLRTGRRFGRSVSRLL